jgi:XTP/dITP diphosphohydrolase
VVAFVTESESHIFEGICRGTILTQPRGDKGFGYDPVFQPNEYDKTFAELDTEIKNKISHRGKAIRKYCKWLQAGN